MTLHMMYEEMISLYILERVKIKMYNLKSVLHNKNGTEKWSRFSGSPINTPFTRMAIRP